MEGFDAAQIESLTNSVVSSALSSSTTEKVPSDTEAAQMYRNLMIYMKNNTQKSVKISNDFNNRVYGQAFPIPDSFDPRKIMDNFVNPITGM
jgi:hypothetical protein